MSKRRIYFVLGLFILANATCLAAALIGPPVNREETFDFGSETSVLNGRKLAITIGNFSFLNDFVTIDVLFIRPVASLDNMIPVASSVIVKSHVGPRVETRVERAGLHLTANFKEGNSIGNRMRLCELGVVDFSSLDVDVMFKFREKRSLAGVISVTYLDSTHAILSFLVRLIFFFSGLVVIGRMWNLKLSACSCRFQLNILFWVMGFVILSSNPLYIFSYFTESPVLPLIDAFLALALVIITCAATLIFLEIREDDPETIDLWWAFNKASSFLIAGSVYFIATVLSQLGMRGKIFQILDVGRSFAAAVGFLRMTIGFIGFESPVPGEKMAMGVMIAVTLIVAIICEISAFIEPLLMADHEIQLFTHASVSIFVFFLTRFYWPVDPNKYIEDDVSSSATEEEDVEETEDDDN
jgi:hypothetical protein